MSADLTNRMFSGPVAVGWAPGDLITLDKPAGHFLIVMEPGAGALGIASPPEDCEMEIRLRETCTKAFPLIFTVGDTTIAAFLTNLPVSDVDRIIEMVARRARPPRTH